MIRCVTIGAMKRDPETDERHLIEAYGMTSDEIAAEVEVGLEIKPKDEA